MMSDESIVSFFCIAFVIFILILNFAEPNCVSEEVCTVEVKVVDTYYVPESTGYSFCGDVISVDTEQAQYVVVVEYEEEKYTIDNRRAYRKYNQNTGQYTNAVVKKKLYEDGTKYIELLNIN